MLRSLTQPQAHGCSLLKHMLQDARRYGVRLELVHTFLAEFHKILWDPYEACDLAGVRLPLSA